MKTFLLFTASFMYSLLAFSGQHEDLASEYIKLSKTKESIDAVIATYADEFSKSDASLTRAELDSYMNEVMGWEVLKKDIADLVIATYSKEELIDINTFLMTTSGKSFSIKMLGLSSELSKIIVDNFNNISIPRGEVLSQLVATANETNKGLPLTLDADTRLDTTLAFGNTFRYIYTLTNYDGAQVDEKILEANMKAGIENGVCTAPELQYFRDNNVTVEYSYKGKDGVDVITIPVLAGKC